MKIQLREAMFSEKEHLFLEDGSLKAYLFRYDSGVCAVKLENEKGYIIVLPYQGQMVWDAVFLIFNPLIAALSLVWLVAFWLLVFGINEIVTAWMHR